jgi:hypothetical protein
MNWTVRGSNPGGGAIFRPGAHPASCTMGTGSFLGVKQPGHGADHPPPSSAEVMKGYSYTSIHPLGQFRPVTGLLYLFILHCNTLVSRKEWTLVKWVQISCYLPPPPPHIHYTPFLSMYNKQRLHVNRKKLEQSRQLVNTRNACNRDINGMQPSGKQSVCILLLTKL